MRTVSKEVKMIKVQRIRELCDSKLFSLYPFDNMAIIHELKIGQKQKGKLWVHETSILEVFFVTLTENSSVVTNDTQGPQKYPPEIAEHGTKNTLVFLPNDGEASWLLLLSSLSLLSCGIVQPENTYSCILKVTCQVWVSQKRISINTNHSYHTS